LAEPLSAGVMAAVLGLDSSKSEYFQRWATAMFSTARHSAHGAEDLDDVEDYFRRELRERSSGGFLGSLVSGRAGGPPLSDDEITAVLRFLLLAGVETVFRATGNCLFALVTHPEQAGRGRQR